MPSPCCWWRWIAAAIASVVLIQCPPSLRAQSVSNRFRVYIDDAQVRLAVQRALADASVVLAGEKCQAVLAEFSDSDRQPLTTRLTALNVSVQAYLRLLIVQDGQQHPRCEQPGILAFTTPGSRAIYVCGEAFVRLSLRTPEEARTTVIHEVLHSLGLGENPPAPSVISHRVKQLCW